MAGAGDKGNHVTSSTNQLIDLSSDKARGLAGAAPGAINSPLNAPFKNK